ncbi:MAG: hypothetical protein LC802_22670, partial [Acidobacteria bacterium]|nr:hypothetical protein [Acidobacteriota bacterium]
MIALFIITFALLAAIAYTFYRRQHASSDHRAELQTRHMSPRSLFDHRETHAANQRFLSAQTSKQTEERNASFLRRAAGGDLTVLTEAQSANDFTLYRSVWHGLLEWAATSETNLRSLVSFVVKNSDLRGSAALVEAYSKLWQQHPDRQSTAQMLHLAALSDDAKTFEQAVEATSNFVLEDCLNGISPEELSTLIESEYWVLSSAARSTGAGFLLKQKLTTVREGLA